MSLRILLDENTTEDFVELLPDFEVRHVHQCGWKGTTNGVLLAAAAGAGFQVLLTVDKQMRHQQNMRGRPLSLVVLDVHPISAPNQIACLAQLMELLPEVKPGEIHVVEGPHPKRGPQRS